MEFFTQILPKYVENHINNHLPIVYMNKVVEWGLVVILGVSGAAGCTPDKKSPKLDDYDIALQWKRDAESEYDEDAGRTKLERALKQFQTAREHGTKPLDSLLQEADIHSMLGDPVTALKLADEVIKQDPAPVAYSVKGLIEQRHGYFAYAIRSFTTSLEKNDYPDVRWARAESYIGLSISRTKIRREFVEKALEDIDKYIASRKDEPDGYLMKASAQCMLEKSISNKPHSKEAYETMKHGVALVTQGKKLRRKILQESYPAVLLQFKELEKEYEPKKEETPEKFH